MLLNLKQMTGRLIRTEEDRGVVVIVDARPDKNYFRRLADALPEGCGIERAGLDDLPRLLREVGIEPTA
jgi:Rad3-related DNA helicase